MEGRSTWNASYMWSVQSSQQPCGGGSANKLPALGNVTHLPKSKHWSELRTKHASPARPPSSRLWLCTRCLQTKWLQHSNIWIIQTNYIRIWIEFYCTWIPKSNLNILITKLEMHQIWMNFKCSSAQASGRTRRKGKQGWSSRTLVDQNVKELQYHRAVAERAVTKSTIGEWLEGVWGVLSGEAIRKKDQLRDSRITVP